MTNLAACFVVLGFIWLAIMMTLAPIPPETGPPCSLPAPFLLFSLNLVYPKSSSSASAKTAVCRSTCASVVVGAIRAMLWKGVMSTPRLSA